MVVVNAWEGALSKLIRNVPLPNSLEMSPRAPAEGEERIESCSTNFGMSISMFGEALKTSGNMKAKGELLGTLGDVEHKTDPSPCGNAGRGQPWGPPPTGKPSSN